MVCERLKTKLLSEPPTGRTKEVPSFSFLANIVSDREQDSVSVGV